MKIVIYRNKTTNKITNYHPVNDRCTEENLRAYNENEEYPTKVEIVELEEDSVAYYFYTMKTTTIKEEAENLRDLMDELERITLRIDDRLYDFDRWFKEERGAE